MEGIDSGRRIPSAKRWRKLFLLLTRGSNRLLLASSLSRPLWSLRGVHQTFSKLLNVFKVLYRGAVYVNLHQASVEVQQLVSFPVSRPAVAQRNKSFNAFAYCATKQGTSTPVQPTIRG
ncbi:uncharacterized protein LOC135145808 [Zophobas morio]|uniref:uncharacterized protein LOC135145808 n=1 Tax=Zophobas morio TaxID=2755281 RepID=UPI0030838918